MEEDNQELDYAMSENNGDKNDHSCLLSKMITRQWEIETNLKFQNNFFEVYQEGENSYIHPDAPLHKLGDIVKKNLRKNNDVNNEIEEEEEEQDFAFEEASPSTTHAHLLSNKLIDLCPHIFRKSLYSNDSIHE